MVVRKNFKLERVERLTFIHDIGKKRLLAYFKDIFFAGMRSTQYMESINSFFRNFVKECRLVEFYMSLKSTPA